MKILVVEDEPDLNHIITKHLKAEGYIVDSCFNGNDAVYYITEESYDAILLDAMLPGKDGFEPPGHRHAGRLNSRHPVLAG